MGMVQRGGKAYAKHIPNTGKWTLTNMLGDLITDNFKD